jgi:hypothetical protein
MPKPLLIILFSLLPSFPAAADTPPEPADQARAAMSEFGQRLRERLVTTMQAEGPVAAIAVCQDEAPLIAREVGAKHGVTLGRTALAVRNPRNQPTVWQMPLLERFDAAWRAGEQLLEETLPPAAGSSAPYRHVRAIRIEGPCLVCHGEQLSDSVSAALAERYPLDLATGYREGDFRGLMWAEVPAR